MFDKFFDNNVDFFKSLLIVATISLIFCFYLCSKYSELKKYEKAFRTALISVAGLSFFAFINMGFMHYSGGFFHGHDTFNRYMGAKYFKEVGYRNLYAAAIVADSEQNNFFGDINSYKYGADFSVREKENAFKTSLDWKGNFTNERWQEFKSDLEFFKQKTDVRDLFDRQVRLDWWNWYNILNDFGLEPSPAWVFPASIISNLLSPANSSTMVLIVLIDFIFLAGIAYFITLAFGINSAMLTLIAFFTMHATIYSWTGSSFMRFDWLFLLVASLSFLKREKYLIAGALLAASSLSASFVLIFALALLIKMVAEYYYKNKISLELKKFFLGFFSVLTVLILLSLIFVNNSFVAWQDFINRSILSLKIWQIWQWNISDIFIWAGESGNTMNDLWQQNKEERFSSLLPLILIVKVAVFILTLLAIRKSEYWETLALGSVLVFTGLYVSQVNFGFLILLIPLLVNNFMRLDKLFAAAIIYSASLFVYIFETFQKNEFFIKFLTALIFTSAISYALYVIALKEDEKELVEDKAEIIPKKLKYKKKTKR